VRIPSFSRQSSTDNAETEATTAAGSTTAATPVRTRTDAPPAPPRQRDSVAAPSNSNTTVLERAKLDADNAKVDADRARADSDRAKVEADRAKAETTRPAERPAAIPAKVDADTDADTDETTETTPVVAGPKPRASLLAALGLMLSVAAALLVLSGPLLGYGIGVAALALVLSLAGIHATRRRHVAGKSDALIGMVVSLAAIVVGVLALTGSLSWLGTDMHPVTSVREWLDAQFANRF
jgi:hypothetical protein